MKLHMLLIVVLLATTLFVVAVFSASAGRVVKRGPGAGVLATNPTACTAGEFVEDLDSDGTLHCEDSLYGKAVTDFAGVNSVIGAAGHIRWSETTIVSGNCVEVDAQGDLTDAGAPCASSGDVESLTSSCTAGQGYLSTGTDADCADVATTADLNAATLMSEVYTGEAASFTLSDHGLVEDLSALGYATMTMDYLQVEDKLDHWRSRSQGDAFEGTNSWFQEGFVCWEPDHTHRIWMNPHCGGIGGKTRYNGKLCTADADCVGGANSTCIHHAGLRGVMWDIDPTQNTISFASDGANWPSSRDPSGHDFGPAGTTFALPMALLRGGTDPPTYNTGGSANYPTCVPTMEDAANYWVHVTTADAEEIIIYKDDGDLTQELGTGDPPGSTVPGDDVALNCSNRSDWISFLLRPRTAAGNDPTKAFKFDINTVHNLGDDAAPDSGVDTGPFDMGAYLVRGNLGAVAYAAEFLHYGVGHVYGRYHDQKVTSGSSFIVDMNAGQCVGTIGYVNAAPNDALDLWNTHQSTIVVTDAQRSAPERVACNYVGAATVPASCMHYGRISNRGASSSFTLTLAAMVDGMDFIVVNETGDSLSVDPDGTERFLAPATDTNGDKLTADDVGDSIRISVVADGEARVIFNSGGWYDDGA